MFNKKVIATGISMVFLATGAAWAGVTANPQAGRTESLDLSSLEGTIPINYVSAVHDGYPVALRGVVLTKPDGSHMLKDATGSVALDIPKDSWTGYLNEPGMTFDVFGTVERDASNHTLVVAARNMNVHEHS